jgi:tetratricopeptide (TPR) repeat protein
MRSFLFLTLSVLTTYFSLGQSNNVVSAYTLLQENRLGEAKEKIDAASEHDRTRNQAKTWFFRGKIYFGMYNQVALHGKQYDMSRQDLLLTAVDSYATARAMNTERIDEQQLNAEYHLLANYLLNEGVRLYNEKTYALAAHLFEKTVEIQKDFQIVDSLAMYNIALASEKAKLYDKALKYYQECASIGYNSEINYQSASSILRSQGENEKALEFIQKGLSKHPSSPDLLIAKINLQLSMKDYDGALFSLEQALLKLPNNADLHFSRGTLLENSAPEESIVCYKRAIDIDPNHISALYNLGAAYYNRAADMRNADNASTDTGKDELRKAQKYLLRVNQLAPEMEKVQGPLRNIKEILEE